jgi:hypothetical protein
MGGSSAPMPYTPASQPQADASYTGTQNSLTAGNQGTYNTAQTGYNTAYQTALNNPYNASAQTGVNAAANTAAQQGGVANQNAQTLNSYAPAIAQAGFDPLSANYNYGLRQTTDAAKVNNAQAGVAGSPFGAGLVNDAGTSYTMAYNADRQARQQQAIAALSALFGDSQKLGQAGTAQQAAAAVAPQAQAFDTNSQIIAALNALVQGQGTASAPLSTDVGNYGKYLQLGQSSTQIADQATAANNAQSGLLGGLGSLFGLSTGGGGTLGGDIIGAL